jgi:hypothetical protein
MYTHPDNAAKLVHDRHRDLSADIGPHRLARQLGDLARSARHTRITPARLRRAWHPILRLRAHG